MKIAEIEERVEEIRALAIDSDDNEAAHSREDQLWHDVLQAIADGSANAKGLAEAALCTIDIDYRRWYS